MESISQRQMRNDSAAILRRVEAGESFVVTNRGVQVARLVPFREGEPDERDALIADGILVPRRRGSADLPTPVVSQVDLAAALDEDRAE